MELERRRPRMRRAVVAAACAVLAAALLPPGVSGAAGVERLARTTSEPPQTWATPADAKLRPGRLVETDGSFCTSNFVFTDDAGHVYLGQAAHCSAKGRATDFDGCKDGSLPIGTPVTVRGPNVRGTLAYNSWLAMQAAKEKDTATCRNNDFALVRLPDDARATVNPSVPYFGGPHGLDADAVAPGSAVYAYGNSPLRANMSLLAPKRGAVVDTVDNGWTHLVYFVTPGVPGDSGSGVLSADGRALGVLSSLNVFPGPASNGVADLARMLAYARTHSGIKGLKLADGTETFAP